MTKPTAILLSGLLLVATSSTATAADDRGLYLGAGLGQFNTQVDDVFGTGYDFDQDHLGFKLFGGYRFFSWLGVEAAFVDGGDPQVRSSNESESLTLGFATQALTASAVLTLPLGSSWELFAKPGVAYWSAKTELTVDSPELSDRFSSDDDGMAFALGAGVNYFAGNAGLRLEYEWFDVDSEFDSGDSEFDDELDSSAEFISLSVIYRFQ